MSYRQHSLSGCVGVCLLVGENVRGGGFVAVCLVGHGGGGGRGWLDVWGLLCWLKERDINVLDFLLAELFFPVGRRSGLVLLVIGG